MECAIKYGRHSEAVMMFGLKFEKNTLGEAVLNVMHRAQGKEKCLVIFVNVDQVVMLQYDVGMREIYSKSICFADGMPLVWLSKILQNPLPERVTGADLFPALVAASVEKKMKLFLLGGKVGVADKAAENLIKKNPGIDIVGTYSPPFGFENDNDECEKIVEIVNMSKADILFIGLGAPKQEKWADKYFEKLDVGPIICVGASFDFMAGRIRRAPKIMQKMSLEWLWRLIREPKRLFHRYLLRDSKFLFLAVREWHRSPSQSG